MSSAGSDATCTVTMTTNKTGITKAFTAIQRTLTIATRPANGTITSNPSGINCGSGAGETTCSDTFDHGTSVTLTAALRRAMSSEPGEVRTVRVRLMQLPVHWI